jgi:hypothetical protein
MLYHLRYCNHFKTHNPLVSHTSFHEITQALSKTYPLHNHNAISVWLKLQVTSTSAVVGVIDFSKREWRAPLLIAQGITLVSRTYLDVTRNISVKQTSKLTACSRMIKKLAISQLAKKSPRTSRNPKIHHRNKKNRHWPLLRARLFQTTPVHLLQHLLQY